MMEKKKKNERTKWMDICWSHKDTLMGSEKRGRNEIVGKNDVHAQSIPVVKSQQARKRTFYPLHCVSFNIVSWLVACIAHARAILMATLTRFSGFYRKKTIRVMKYMCDTKLNPHTHTHTSNERYTERKYLHNRRECKFNRWKYQ